MSFPVCILPRKAFLLCHSVIPFSLSSVFCQLFNSHLLTLFPLFLNLNLSSLCYHINANYHHLRESIFYSCMFLKSALEEIINDAIYSSRVQSLWKYKQSMCLCSAYKLVMSLECFPVVIKTHSVKMTAF